MVSYANILILLYVLDIFAISKDVKIINFSVTCFDFKTLLDIVMGQIFWMVL